MSTGTHYRHLCILGNSNSAVFKSEFIFTYRVVIVQVVTTDMVNCCWGSCRFGTCCGAWGNLVKTSNLICARFSLIIILCVALQVYWTEPYLHAFINVCVLYICMVARVSCMISRKHEVEQPGSSRLVYMPYIQHIIDAMVHNPGDDAYGQIFYKRLHPGCNHMWTYAKTFKITVVHRLVDVTKLDGPVRLSHAESIISIGITAGSSASVPHHRPPCCQSSRCNCLRNTTCHLGHGSESWLMWWPKMISWHWNLARTLEWLRRPLIPPAPSECQGLILYIDVMMLLATISTLCMAN